MMRRIFKPYYVFLAALTVFMLVSSPQANAQQSVYPGGWCAQGCSDYYFYIITNYKVSHAGWCGGTTASGGTDGSNSYACPGNAFNGIPTQDSGLIMCPLGPNYNVPDFYMSEHSTCNNSCTGSGDFGHVWTNPINSPNNVSAATGTYSTAGSRIQFATVTWSKGSDMPDSTITYNIYRNSVKIGSAKGGVYSFNDSSLLGTNYYSYYVTTHTDSFTGTSAGPPSWSAQESGPSGTSYVYISNDLLTASQGTGTGLTQLSWPNLAAFSPSGIQVFKNGQQLAVINANATTYTDYSGVPGVVYQYSIAPINSNNQSPLTFFANGYSKPNGSMSGYVKSTQNSGVPGVTVTAQAVVDSDGYNYGSHTDTYTSVTDNTGYYSMSNMFYNSSAVYSITASRDSDKFNPGITLRTLNIQNYQLTVPDIIDTSAYTVSGHVYFKPLHGITYFTPSDTLIPLSGAHLSVNGVNTGDTTDANGRYSFTANVIGNYSVSFTYQNHRFDSVRTRYVSDNTISALNFYDLTTDTLQIDLKSGCNLRIVDTAAFTVTSVPGGQISTRIHFDGSDPVQIVLPATKYAVDIFNTATVQGITSLTISTDPSPGLAKLNTINIDLTHRDTNSAVIYDTVITHIDTAFTQIFQNNDTVYTAADTIRQVDSATVVSTPISVAKFIYQFPISMTIEQLPYLCNTNNSIFVVNQGVTYYPKISVYQQSIYITTQTCPLDSGSIEIYDYVSGAGLVTGQLTNGVYYYPLVPGSPNIPSAPGAHQYQDLLYINATAPSGQSVQSNAWMIIQGDRDVTATYNTTPQIPLMILHAPPGDQSFSYLSKDSSVSLSTSIDQNSQFAGGGQAQIALGDADGPIPEPFENFTFQGQGGYNKDSNTVTAWTYTANQTISTTPGGPYVGMMGDVFIGAAMNMKYATAFQLNIDSSTCLPVIDTVLLYGIDSVSTKFIYSVYDLENTIIPNLINLREIADSSADSTYNKAYFQNQINVWYQALAHDSVAIANSQYTNNISFTAGTSDNYSYTADVAQTTSYTYAITGSIATQLLLGYTNANAFTVGAGAVFNWNTSSGKTGSNGLDQSTTYGYQLSDDVPGNYYSVNIGADKFYGSPVFQIFGGASACPWEPGTQHRDVPTLTIDPPLVQNVPANALASMIAYLGNQSESQEPRTYLVSLDPSSNPNGAIVTIGGQNITQSAASFTVVSGGSLPTSLTVQKGPFAADYTLNISISSSCDPNISVTVPITVNFQNSCSEVSLIEPADGWLINGNSGDTLTMDISGYDVSNASLQEIGIQYRSVGTTGLGTSQWAPMQSTIQDSATLRLNPVYTNIFFNTSALPDGNYQIQAYAHCGTGINSVYTYSNPLNGVIDRASFSLFGTPTPSDGTLNLGGTIGITFNDNIDCSGIYGNVQTSLTRTDNGVIIPSAYSCSGNGLILTTTPDSLINSLNGVELTASVNNIHDVNGNGINHAITWNFIVNTSKIYWSPANINVSATVGTAPTISATMLNLGQPSSFTLVKVPSWLTVNTAGPYNLNQGTSQTPSQLPISFTVSNSLNEGQYSDTVIAMANGSRLLLFVNVDVVTQAPTWSVNANNYQYSMNITANYSVDSANTPLSTDTRDIIAAFVGNQCRGVGTITYNATSNTYSAFITAYSNSALGDTFSFRMWDALPGIEYQAKERLPFISDGSIGQTFSPYILHAAGEFQTIAFSAGWNWFSLNVASADMSPKNVLGSITANNGAVVKTQGSYAQFTSANTGWTGSLSAFNTNSSYMINLDHADTLHFLGQSILDTSIIQVASGWNWIGFPTSEDRYCSFFPGGRQSVLPAIFLNHRQSLRNIQVVYGQAVLLICILARDTSYRPLMLLIS